MYCIPLGDLELGGQKILEGHNFLSKNLLGS